MTFSIKGRAGKSALTLLIFAFFAVFGPTANAQTLKTIKDRGVLVCGVSQGIAGFSVRSPQGDWTGFDVDFCRALAAAIFNDVSKVKFVPLSTTDRFRALQSSEIDILSRNSTWTMSREIDLGLAFAATTYYDGQGFMVRTARKIDSALELNGSRVCVQSDTTTALNLSDYFKTNGMTFVPVLFNNAEDATKAYDSNQCDVLTSDTSQLYAARIGLTKPDDHVILPDIISKEPLGPVIREGDPQWLNIVKWTHFAMVNAEELGVSSHSMTEALSSKKPDVRRLLGTDGDYGEKMGLTKDWAARIIRLVGNYAEVFDRNLGVKTQLGIPRGINQLWSMGGILYAPPIR
jgi:general L-amino acid transport system substrate-binding protein